MDQVDFFLGVSDPKECSSWLHIRLLKTAFYPNLVPSGTLPIGWRACGRNSRQDPPPVGIVGRPEVEVSELALPHVVLEHRPELVHVRVAERTLREAANSVTRAITATRLTKKLTVLGTPLL